jgi:hypothetical protein
MLWYTLMIPALQRQEDQEFRASLSYKPRPSRGLEGREDEQSLDFA